MPDSPTSPRATRRHKGRSAATRRRHTASSSPSSTASSTASRFSTPTSPTPSRWWSATRWHAYATDTYGSVHIPGAHIPVIAITRATGFSGHYLGDALPTVPTWTVSGYQWAPSVWARPDGTYVLYYATPATHPMNCVAKPTSYGCVETTHGPNTAMCISRATSTNPAGPFVDDSASPFVCPYAQGGAIDPSIYVRSDGTAWLLWKSDGDCLQRADVHLLPTALPRRTVDGRGTPRAHRRHAGLGGRPGRGTIDDQGGEHLLALLLGQSLGGSPTTASASPPAPRSSAPA